MVDKFGGQRGSKSFQGNLHGFNTKKVLLGFQRGLIMNFLIAV